MNRSKLVILLSLGGIYFTQCAAAVALQGTGPASGRIGYVGDTACQACHKEVSQSFQHTAHHLTSQLPAPGSLPGSFDPGANTLTIVDPAKSALPGLQFRMESRKSGFFEVARSGWGSDVYERADRIDIVTGSGHRGQTYLYWRGDRLFELPISYWSDGHRWINSPGYIDGTAIYSRGVLLECLECHATYIRALSSDAKANRYARASLIPGISCENCHGPGAEHVRRKTRHEASRKDAAEDILNPAKFSRDRQVDLCAECHNGIQREALAPPFSYVPGQPLSEHYKQLSTPDVSVPDVHGNQVGLLQRSQCYRSSEKMNCSICHDVHTAGQPAASYSSKCLGCHQWQSCGMSAKMGHAIVDKCIDCHMPVQQTNAIVSTTAGQVVHATMRNHWIKVYPDAKLPETAAQP